MSDSSPTTAELDNTQLQQAKDTAAWLIEEAKRQGADAAEVGVSLSQGYSVNVRQGEVETVEFHRDRGVSVTVYKGQRKGHASSSDDNRDSLRATLAAATAIAGYTEEDRYAGLAPAADLAREVTDLDLYHPWAMDTQSAIEQALRCETVARDDARIVNSEGASVNSGASLRVYATSEGFLHGYRGTHHSRVCSVVAEDEAGMQRDYWYDGGRVGDRLASAEAVGEQARERALARLGAEVPETGELPVIFAPEVASGLLGHLVSAISGGALYRRSSFLQDCLGKAVLPAGFQLTENPHLAAGNASAPFDGGGLPTRAQAFVEDGVLKQYALGLYASRRLDMAPTHFRVHGEQAALFYDGDAASAVMAKVELLTDESLETASTVASQTLASAHHGVAEPRGDVLLATFRTAASGLPETVDVYHQHGDHYHKEDTITPTCPDLHGAGSNEDYSVFGCSDGILIVHQDGEDVTAEKVTNATLGLGAGERIGSFDSHHELSHFVGYAGDRILVIHPEDGDAEELDWTEGAAVTLESHRLDPHGEHLVLLDDAGDLRIFDTADWSEHAHVEDAIAPGNTQMAVAGEPAHVFLSDTDNNAIVVVHLEEGSLESPLSLTFPPAALAWAGLDSDHEEEHSDEDEHDHDDDDHDHDH